MKRGILKFRITCSQKHIFVYFLKYVWDLYISMQYTSGTKMKINISL